MNPDVDFLQSALAEASVQQTPERQLNALSLYHNNIKTFELFDEVQLQVPAEHDPLEDPTTRALKEDLLRFEHIITEHGINRLGNDSHHVSPHSIIPEIPLNDLYRDSGSSDTSRELQAQDFSVRSLHEDQYHVAKHNRLVKVAVKVSRRAQEIQTPDEQLWEEPIKDILFGETLKYSTRAMGMKGGTFEDALQMITKNSNHPWYGARDLFHGSWSEEKRRSPDFRPLTAPKPDLYLAFPIFNWEGTTNPTLGNELTNFNLEFLTQLDAQGLLSCPMRRISNTSSREDQTVPTSIASQDLWWGFRSGNNAAQRAPTVTSKCQVCFPWAIAELKHAKKPGVSANPPSAKFQVANAAAASLLMFSNLAQLGFKKTKPEWTPPVIGFTFDGPVVGVWLAKICHTTGDSNPIYSIRQIWAGSLLNLWDTIQLCNIIDRVNVWGTTRLRPWISSRLDQWKAGSPEVENLELRNKLADERTKSERLQAEVDQLRSVVQQERNNVSDQVAAANALQAEVDQLRFVIQQERNIVSDHVTAANTESREYWRNLAEAEGTGDPLNSLTYTIAMDRCAANGTDIVMSTLESEMQVSVRENPWSTCFIDLVKALSSKMNEYKTKSEEYEVRIDSQNERLETVEAASGILHEYYSEELCAQLDSLKKRYEGLKDYTDDPGFLDFIRDAIRGKQDAVRNWQVTALSNPHVAPPLSLQDITECVAPLFLMYQRSIANTRRVHEFYLELYFRQVMAYTFEEEGGNTTASPAHRDKMNALNEQVRIWYKRLEQPLSNQAPLPSDLLSREMKDRVDHFRQQISEARLDRGVAVNQLSIAEIQLAEARSMNDWLHASYEELVAQHPPLSG